MVDRHGGRHAAFSKQGGPTPSMRFDEAMTVLESAGLGDAGRSGVEAMFRPGGPVGVVTRGRFEQATQALARIADQLTLNPELGDEIGRRQYQESIESLGHQVASAYRRGVAPDGPKLHLAGCTPE